MSYDDMTDDQLARARAFRTYSDLYLLEFMGLVFGIGTLFMGGWAIWQTLAITGASVLLFLLHFGVAYRTGLKMSREEAIADIRFRNEVARESEDFM